MDEQYFLKNYISSIDAARTYRVTNDYVARLSRQGKLKGLVRDRITYVERDSLRRFFIKQGRTPAEATTVAPVQIRQALDSQYVSSRDAARLYGVTHDYLARLCRQGKLEGTLQDRTWLIARDSLRTFFAGKGRAEPAAIVRAVPPAPMQRSALVPAPATSAEIPFVRRILVPVAIGFLFIMSGALAHGLVPRADSTAAVARVESPFFSSGLFSRDFWGTLASMFVPKPVSVATAPPAQTEQTYTRLSVAPGSVSSASSTTATYIQNTYPVVERTTLREVVVPGGFVTYDFLNTQVSRLQDTIADHGNGGGITDFSSLTADDIPDLSGTYLPLAGGTLSGLLTAPYASTTMVTATTASSSALIISGLGNTGTECLQITSSGAVSSTGSACGAGGSSFSYPFPSNATSTLLAFNGGLTSASTTLTGNFVFANATGTNATTTNFAVSSLASGRVPFVAAGGALVDSPALTFSGSTLAVTGGVVQSTSGIFRGDDEYHQIVFHNAGNNTDYIEWGDTLANGGGHKFFTGGASPTLRLQIADDGTYIQGNVGIGTTSPYAKLSVVGEAVAAYFTATTTTVSTFPYASTTVLSATTICISGDCRSAWPSGGSSFSYPFPSNATTTQIAFNGGATFVGATTTALAVTGSTTISSVLNVGGAINASGGITGALTGNVTGDVSGNAGTVTNGVYTTTFNSLFDPRFITQLAGTSSIASIITLGNLSLPYSQLTGAPSIAAYPFPSNATTTLITFSGGLSSASTTLTGPFVFANATGTSATTTNFAITAISSSLLKTNTNGTIVAAVAGVDYAAAGSSFAYPFPSNATSTSIAFNGGLTASSATITYASTTVITVSGTASTTALIVSGLNAASCDVKASTSGVLSCGTDASAAGAGAYPFAGTGNSTSTLTQFNAGLTAFASSTIGNGTLGLTVSGNATTTGIAYFIGNIGIGSSTPLARLTLHANQGDTNRNLIAVASSTSSSVYSTITSASPATNDTGWAGYTMRQTIAAAQLSNTGNSTTRVTFTASAASALTISNAYIGEKAGAGDAYDFATTPVQLTFNGGSSGATISAGQTLTSDPVSFTVTGASDIIVSFYMASNGNTMIEATRTGWVPYYRNANDASTVNATGYTDCSASCAPTAAVQSVSLVEGLVSTNSTNMLFALDNTGLVTLLNLLANNATSTNLFGGRVTGNTAAFGGTASTTIDSAGAIVAPSTLNIAGIITSTATGASVLPYASTTMITAATASTTALIVSGLNAASCDIKADTNGVLSCGTDLTGPAYPFAGTGNSTSTLTQFNAGLTAFASTTIGAGGQTTGLTISGGATTTGQAYFAGNVGIGTTSPFAKLAVQANNGETNTNLFAIGSSTASATTTLFSVDNTGKTTIANTVVVQGTGTSTYAGGIEATTFNLTSASATSTAANGINLTGGCYAVNGTCIGQVAKLTAIRTYTSDQTYTKPSNLAYVVVETWGGGGGASGMTGGFDANTSDGSSAMRIGGDGAAGTASSFGAHLSAAGGGAGTNASTTECIVGAGGSGSSGDVNLAGESGFKRNMMSSDQTSHNRMPQDALAAFAITFAHGASPSTSTRATGEFSNSTYSCGGGAGGYSQKVVQAASISGTEAVTVGVGGGGGGGGGMDGDEGISFAITQGAGGDGTVGASASGTSGGGGGGGGGGDGWDDTSDVAISAGGAAAAASGTTGGAGGGGGAASGNDQNGANIGGEGDGAAASGTTGGGGGGGSGAGATNTDSGNGASAAGMAGGSGGGGADDPDGDGNNGGPAGASNSTGGAGGGGGGAGSSGAGATGSTATGSAGGAGAAGGTGATNSGGGGGGGGAGLSGGALGTGTNGGTNGTAGGTANGGNGGAGGSDSTNDPGGGGGGGGWSGGTGGSGGTTGNGQGGGGGGGGGGAMGVTGGTGGAGGTGASGTGGSNLNGGSGGGGGGGAGTAGISGGHGSNGRSASYGTSGGGGGGGGGGGTIGMSGGGGGGRAYEYENVDAGAGGGGGGGGAAGGSHGAFGGRGGYQSLGGGDCSEDYCGVSSFAGPGGNGGGGGFVVVYEYTYSTPGADLAETYPTTDATLAPGEIVAFDVANDIHVKRASRTDTSPLAGVISTAPGLVLGLNPDNAAGERPVALSGRVPVRVNLTGGAIQVGDRIALSETPGIGRRATQFEPSVGIALEAYNGGSQATVMIFLDLQAGVSINSIAQGLLGLDVGTSTMPVDFVGAMFGALSGRIASTTGAVASTSAAVASSTAQFVDALFGAFIDKLASFGIYITQEFTLIKNLIASQFTVGSAEQPAGITLYDTQTHEPYCVQVQGGELVYLSGECTATSTPLVPEDAATTTEEFDNPFEEDADADEQATPPQEGLDEQASSSTEVPDQDSIDNATTTPITPESTAEPTPEPEPEPAPAQQPAPEPEPEPEPQAEQPAQEPEPAPEPSV